MELIDFSFDLDFMENEEPRYLDICGLFHLMKSKEKRFFNIENEVKQLTHLMGKLPGQNDCYKMISVGGFSSIAIIEYVAEREVIEELLVSTFRIGKKQFEVLNNLYGDGRLKKASFITSLTQVRTDDAMMYNGNTYKYYDYILECCEENGWEVCPFDNHSKVILMKTKDNWYVVETSSNLNENPKMEQFSFENDDGLFNWYKNILKGMIDNERKN